MNKVPKRVKFYDVQKYCVNYMLKKSLVASGSKKKSDSDLLSLKRYNIFCTSVFDHSLMHLLVYFA